MQFHFAHDRIKSVCSERSSFLFDEILHSTHQSLKCYSFRDIIISSGVFELGHPSYCNMDALSLPSEVTVEAAAAEDARDSDTFRISSEQNEAPAQVGHSGTNGAPKGAMDSGNGAKVEGLERGQEPSQKEDWPSTRGSTAPARAFSLRSRARRFWNQILTWKVCGSPWRVHWITRLHSKVSQEKSHKQGVTNTEHQYILYTYCIILKIKSWESKNSWEFRELKKI